MFAMVLDPEAIIEKGLFQGFNMVVAGILILQAVTGLVSLPMPFPLAF